jgi:RNA polymerase sigma-70 factor, ECF subfamily
MAEKSHGVTALLVEWRTGTPGAGEKLMETVYEELRCLADHYMSRERSGHTLQATALVNELYIRLFGRERVQFHDRSHFFAVAAQQMRRLLVDHARVRKSQKRGGERVIVTLDGLGQCDKQKDLDVLVINEALDELQQLDERAAKVIELRFFGGMSEPEAAEALKISLTTVKRDWEFARAWLLDRLQSDQ